MPQIRRNFGELRNSGSIRENCASLNVFDDSDV
jgi:hypothetical protein